MFESGNMGGAAILDSIKEANLHMQRKGALGVATLLLKADDIVDIVKIVLPSPASVRQEQEADNWGQFWVGVSYDFYGIKSATMISTVW